MKISQDNTSPFIPSSNLRMFFLGTMVAICARDIEGRKKEENTFYYHNNRNHFWRVLQHLFVNEAEVKKRLTLQEKKDFLEKYGIGILNIVHEIQVLDAEIDDPSDTVLFKAHKKNRLSFHRESEDIIKSLKSVPLFFTCRAKTGINHLIKGYFDFNELSSHYLDKIWYLPTPTRCNPKARSVLWKNEMNQHMRKSGFSHFCDLPGVLVPLQEFYSSWQSV